MLYRVENGEGDKEGEVMGRREWLRLQNGVSNRIK